MNSSLDAPRPRSALRDDQKFVANLMWDEPVKLIVAPMGRGKTAASLTATRYLHDIRMVRHTLVIAPKRVSKDTWPDEIATWEHTRPLSVATCFGWETPKKRAAAVSQRAEVTICNRENLPWLWKHVGQGKDWFWDQVIVDESSMFKAGKKRTKKRQLTRFGVLAAARKYIDRIYLLTGTPAPGGEQDLWGQVYLLDKGERLGRTKQAFLDRWFNQCRYSYRITPKPGAKEEIMRRIKDVMVSLPPLKLVPDPIFHDVFVDLPGPVMEEYRRFERSMVSEAHDVEAVSKGVLTNKLLQFANGSMYREDKSIAEVHGEKLKALNDLIEEAQGDNVLIFYGFKFDLDQIRKAHPDAVVLNEEPNAVELWNQGKIRKLLAHPASCAHGLNMQYGGHVAIWYGLTWSLELYLQANARLPRPGQKNQVIIYRILARGTNDERLVNVLAQRNITQDEINDAVRTGILS